MTRSIGQATATATMEPPTPPSSADRATAAMLKRKRDLEKRLGAPPERPTPPVDHEAFAAGPDEAPDRRSWILGLQSEHAQPLADELVKIGKELEPLAERVRECRRRSRAGHAVAVSLEESDRYESLKQRRRELIATQQKIGDLSGELRTASAAPSSAVALHDLLRFGSITGPQRDGFRVIDFAAAWKQIMRSYRERQAELETALAGASWADVEALVSELHK